MESARDPTARALQFVGRVYTFPNGPILRFGLFSLSSLGCLGAQRVEKHTLQCFALDLVKVNNGCDLSHISFVQRWNRAMAENKNAVIELQA